MVIRAIGFGVLCMAALLTGCQGSQVMQKRPFVPEAEREPWSGQPQKEVLVAEEVEVVAVVPVKTQKAQPEQFRPMEGSWSQEGPKIAAPTGAYYTVQKGDILGRVARKHGTTAGKIAQYNGFDISDPIKVGQKLQIPPTDYAGGAVSGKKTSDTKSAKTSEKTADKPTRTTASADAPADGLYTVASGDSVGKIANKFGIKQKDLLAANHMDARTIIRPGQRLVIPKGSSGATSAPKAGESTVVQTPPKSAGESQNLDNIGEEDDAAAVETAELINDDISVEAFAAKHGTTVEALGTVNLMPADAMFRKDSLVLIPQK